MELGIENLIRAQADLDAPLKKEVLRGLFATEDKLGHVFQIEVNRSGQPVDLTGKAVTGDFIRYRDKTTVMLTGSANGNVLTVTLSEGCYLQPGGFCLFVHVGEGDARLTLYAGEGNMLRSRTSAIYDENNIIPSLDDLLAEIEALRETTAAAKEAIAGANTSAEGANQAAKNADTSASGANDAASAALTATEKAQASAAAADKQTALSQEATQFTVQAAESALKATEGAYQAAQIANQQADLTQAAIQSAENAAHKIDVMAVEEESVPYGQGVQAALDIDPETGGYLLKLQVEQGPQGVQGIQGPKGDEGKPFKILGTYPTLEALTESVTGAEVGDLYNVGVAPPYETYRWTGTEWQSLGYIQGPVGPQGAPGADGVSPTVNIEKNDGETVITITDHQGEHLATILDGVTAKELGLVLAAESWQAEGDGFGLVAEAQGLTSTQAVVVSPAPESLRAYGKAGARATQQEENALHFWAERLPDEALLVNVLMIDL